MSLIDLAHTSLYGPNNPGSLGTGTVLGPNTNPLENAQLGNPEAGGVVFNKLEDAAHSSRYGSFNGNGQRGTGIIVDTLGNIPAEPPFDTYP